VRDGLQVSLRASIKADLLVTSSQDESITLDERSFVGAGVAVVDETITRAGDGPKSFDAFTALRFLVALSPPSGGRRTPARNSRATSMPTCCRPASMALLRFGWNTRRGRDQNGGFEGSALPNVHSCTRETYDLEEQGDGLAERRPPGETP
jgi:hypothetical protein